ncbi:hypothetical protein WR25_26687 [Diploscapter pachys]|uniref:Uncharacterized protein n=1 Tax=Diploscapter pachys TaxID=2018661 RepID=A0A2A2L944_9BILA|nr:hypothetical protein WR25_26687 [Diploscapter pachys]
MSRRAGMKQYEDKNTKKHAKPVEVIGVIIQSTDWGELSVCHVDESTLKPYLHPFPQHLWKNLEKDLKIRVTRKEDLIGEWVMFTMDEWEELAEDRPIRGFGSKPPIKTRVTRDFHVEVCCVINIGKNLLTIIPYPILLLTCAIIEFWVLDSVTHDGRSSLNGLAVCISNVGYAIDVYRFIEIDGRAMKNTPCWLRCKRYNSEIAWCIEELVMEQSEQLESSNRASEGQRRENRWIWSLAQDRGRDERRRQDNTDAMTRRDEDRFRVVDENGQTYVIPEWARDTQGSEANRFPTRTLSNNGNPIRVELPPEQYEEMHELMRRLLREPEVERAMRETSERHFRRFRRLLG